MIIKNVPNTKSPLFPVYCYYYTKQKISPSNSENSRDVRDFCIALRERAGNRGIPGGFKTSYLGELDSEIMAVLRNKAKNRLVLIDLFLDSKGILRYNTFGEGNPLEDNDESLERSIKEFSLENKLTLEYQPPEYYLSLSKINFFDRRNCCSVRNFMEQCELYPFTFTKLKSINED